MGAPTDSGRPDRLAEDFSSPLSGRIVIACGRNPWTGRGPSEVTVTQVMRRNFTPVPAAAQFKEVIGAIGHSHANLFPVVNADETLVGIIRYADIRDALFDPGIGRLFGRRVNRHCRVS